MALHRQPDRNAVRQQALRRNDGLIQRGRAIQQINQTRRQWFWQVTRIGFQGIRLDRDHPQAEVGCDQSYTDVMVGGRYTARLGEKWTMTTRVDGGWGDTDGTINASVMFGRKLGAGSLMLGYRYFDVEVSRDTTDIDVTMQGPVLAYAFGL